MIYSDASKYGLDCVLIPNGNLIAYAYAYPTHDLELAAAVFALKL